MVSTKLEMWIGVSALVLIFGIAIATVGANLMTADDVILDERSQDYVDEFSSNIADNNFQDFADNATLEEKKTNPILDAITSLPLVEDFLGAVKFFTEKTAALMSFISFVYNLPTFFLQGFGLDPGDFDWVINILTYAVFLGITIGLVRLVK